MHPPIRLRPALLSLAAIALGACSNELDHAKDCYSPSQNVDIALDKDAHGCACAKDDTASCVQSADHGYVAFFCDGGRWHSGFDGPCEAVLNPCYAPTQNLDLTYQSGAQGCACNDADVDQCVQGVALVCEGGYWSAVLDGPCAPPPPPEPCYAPTQNPELARTPGTQGCACGPDDHDVCINGVALVCQGERWRSVEDGPCSPSTLLPACPPGSARSNDADPNCVPQKYTLQACAAVRGVAIADPGDGSVIKQGCPRKMLALGFIDAGWDEGGLCCQPTVASCAPQKAHFEGTCEPAPRFFWTGAACVGLTGCKCVGADCQAGFPNEAACQAAFAGCASTTTACGARAGDCKGANAYCAYQPDGICGRADAESVCAPRPTACDDVAAPVCGCDGKTYSNECEANLAGTGIYQFAPCTERR